MTLRLEQIHPAVVHFPIAMLPLAVASEVAGDLTGSRRARRFAGDAIKVAALGAVASAVTGLLAGEEVNVEGESRDRLMLHRNLNAGVTLLACGMAIWRAGNDRPGPAYLAAGLAGTALLGFTAYLGGKLVYDDGVGVGPADGVYRPDAPVLGRDPTGAFIGDAARGVLHGAGHLAEEVAQGYLLPGIAGKSNPAPADAATAD